MAVLSLDTCEKSREQIVSREESVGCYRYLPWYAH